MENDKALTEVEAGILAECEAVIERGRQSFIEVGNALLKVRDGRLYRREYATFEDYCRDRWDVSRIHAHRLMDAAEVVKNVLPIGNIPKSESQVRPLAQLEPAQQVTAWEKVIETAPKGIVTAAHVQSVVDEMKPRPHVSQNTGRHEWYTPPEYIHAARKVMGRIDLDPASSDAANLTVKATQYYTKEDDGLSLRWRGRVWLNPPYAADLIGAFCEKLRESYAAGDISEAIVLVNNATETEWFGNLVSVARAIVFPHSRVRFLDSDGNPGAPLQGQAVIYVGERPEKFIECFGVFGWRALL